VGRDQFKVRIYTFADQIAPSSAVNFPHSPYTKAEFKEFEPKFKFKPVLKFCWFHLSLYQIFQDLSRRSIETGSRRSIETGFWGI